MPLKIPNEDRIYNISPLPEGFNPNDPTLVNADWIMNMLDKIVNGNYATKSFNVVPTIDDLPLGAEQGQTAYIVQEEYADTFFIYNGTSWININDGGDQPIPVVNNSTITIKQGDTVKGTFTLNQSTDETIILDAGSGDALPSQAGNNGKFLTTNGTTLSWANVPGGEGLPDQTGNDGKFLTTNGSTLSWARTFPPLDGKAGKFLTNNGGTTVFWADVDTLPSQSGQEGKFLTTNGITASWATITGGQEITQVDFYNNAETDYVHNITDDISIDVNKYVSEITDDTSFIEYTYDGTNWKNDEEETVDLEDLGIDLSSATYSSGSSFAVKAMCLTGKSAFAIPQIFSVHNVFLNGNLLLMKDYNINGNNELTIKDYTLKETDSISIMAEVNINE